MHFRYAKLTLCERRQPLGNRHQAANREAQSEDRTGAARAIIAGHGYLPADARGASRLGGVFLEPNTRDPFDRLLLAQCKVEEMRLIRWTARSLRIPWHGGELNVMAAP